MKISFNSARRNGRTTRRLPPRHMTAPQLLPKRALIVSVSRLGMPVTRSKQRMEIVSNRQETRGICNISRFLITPSNFSTSGILAFHLQTPYLPHLRLAERKFDSIGRGLLGSPRRGGLSVPHCPRNGRYKILRSFCACLQ